jgi:hypothetical protein
MLPERPDTDEYTKLCDHIADLKEDLQKAERQYEKQQAKYVFDAMKRGAKTRELDCVKLLGNSSEEERLLDEIFSIIVKKKKEVNLTQSAINTWLARKDLYISDNYHQIRGSSKWFANSSE